MPQELPGQTLAAKHNTWTTAYFKQGNSPLGGGTVDDTVLFGPWPTSGNIGHRKGCGSRCRAFGEMINRSCSQGSAPAYRLQPEKKQKKQNNNWHSARTKGLLVPLPRGAELSGTTRKPSFPALLPGPKVRHCQGAGRGKPSDFRKLYPGCFEPVLRWCPADPPEIKSTD